MDNTHAELARYFMASYGWEFRLGSSDSDRSGYTIRSNNDEPEGYFRIQDITTYSWSDKSSHDCSSSRKWFTLFSKELSDKEISDEKWIEIVTNAYEAIGKPSMNPYIDVVLKKRAEKIINRHFPAHLKEHLRLELDRFDLQKAKVQVKFKYAEKTFKTSLEDVQGCIEQAEAWYSKAVAAIQDKQNLLKKININL